MKIQLTYDSSREMNIDDGRGVIRQKRMEKLLGETDSNYVSIHMPIMDMSHNSNWRSRLLIIWRLFRRIQIAFSIFYREMIFKFSMFVFPNYLILGLNTHFVISLTNGEIHQTYAMILKYVKEDVKVLFVSRFICSFWWNYVFGVNRSFYFYIKILFFKQNVIVKLENCQNYIYIISCFYIVIFIYIYQDLFKIYQKNIRRKNVKYSRND